ncbi:hypothetical protein NDN08_007233 [Rhodosorus marinus]|uniref:C2H2-type domain-containing protein n=1 Tax=Rhodosorus marinus TaxID=101924 RepID=A0AAV8UJM7_9RHOD|nr:hypothetical protein NDN08_007233 [Rhodosorus marinus]
MDALVRRMDLTVGEHVSELSPVLKWDSIPANWILFRLHKQAVPHASDWSILLADPRINVPEATAQAMAASEIARMVSVVTLPILMMTEVQEENYSLGSGWAFLGGLPELDGRSNASYSGVQSIRTMSMIENGKALVVLSSEVAPGVLAIMRNEEVDGRHNITTYTVVNKETQTVLGTQSFLNRRQCDMCILTGDNCDPRTCRNDPSFDVLRESRKSILAKMPRPVCNMQYLMQLFSGKWTMPVGPLEPITMEWNGHVSGASFRYALVSVVQIETERVHPPRSTFRIVKQGQLEMDYFLELEVQNMSSTSEESTMASDELIAQVQISGGSGSIKKKRGSQGKMHRCDTCGMSFKRGYDMKRHRIAVHEKIRDFKCTYCERSFTQSGHLHEHVRLTHTGDNVHACPVCEKAFGAKSKLERHVRNVHKNESNFRCAVCKCTYKAKAYLKIHLLKQHNVKMDELRDLSANLSS